MFECLHYYLGKKLPLVPIVEAVRIVESSNYNGFASRLKILLSIAVTGLVVDTMCIKSSLISSCVVWGSIRPEISAGEFANQKTTHISAKQKKHFYHRYMKYVIVAAIKFCQSKVN